MHRLQNATWSICSLLIPDKSGSFQHGYDDQMASHINTILSLPSIFPLTDKCTAAPFRTQSFHYDLAQTAVTLFVLNVNGWTNVNKQLRESIVDTANRDIFFIVET